MRGSPAILKKLYMVTKDQATFSLNDMRKHDIHREFEKKNQIGSFFRWLSGAGYTKTVGHTRVEHEAGNKRWIWNWRWTEKAHEEFGGKAARGQTRLF